MVYEILGVICLYGIAGVVFWNYMLTRLVKPWLDDRDSVQLSIAVLKVGVFLSNCLSVSTLYDPLDALQIILQQRFEKEDLYIEFGSLCSNFILIMFLWNLSTFVITILLYGALNRRRNIFVSVGNNDLPSTLVFVGIYLSLTISLLSGLGLVFDGLIPYPTVPVYQ